MNRDGQRDRENRPNFTWQSVLVARPLEQICMDPTLRFSDRVENYESYRPRYPDGVLQILRQETALSPQSTVADIGSGTGLSSELFLENGNTVFAVEPNRHMRQAAERRLKRYAGFHSVSGTAEATSLSERSIDHVVAGQSFHWFDPQLAKRELARVLRPKGWVVLLWNTRRADATPFLEAYEALLQRFGTDYREVRHRNIDLPTLCAFFSNGSFCRRALYNEQRLNLQELQGRLLSSSYTPSATHPAYEPMLRELERILRAHNQDGVVRLEYDVEIYIGHLTQPRMSEHANVMICEKKVGPRDVRGPTRRCDCVQRATMLRACGPSAGPSCRPSPTGSADRRG